MVAFSKTAVLAVKRYILARYHMILHIQNIILDIQYIQNCILIQKVYQLGIVH